MGRARERRALVVLLAVAAGLGALGGCARAPRGPTIVLVVLDTVRRDFTGVAAGDSTAAATGLTPELDRIAAEGTEFTAAFANAPWTVPSHASMFTGLLPSEHGCSTANIRFAPPAPTVAELLARAGYRTAAFFSNPWLADRTTGLLRGFAERFEVPIGGLDALQSADGDQGGRGVLARLGAWLDKLHGRRPAFIFINFLEAHLPYDPPADYRRLHLADLPPRDTVSIQWAHEFNAGLHPPQLVNWSRVRRLYGGDVNTADRLLAGVVQQLQRKELWDDCVLIVTSDHGENLGDHDLVEHQFSVHESLLSVPLVVRAPALAAKGLLPPGRDGRPVMLLDLYATILQAAGVQPPSPPRRSESLLAPGAAAAAAGARARPLIAEYDGPGSGLLGLLRQLNPSLDEARLSPALRAVRVGDWCLIESSSGARSLYDLRDDPGELRDLAAADPRRAASLDSTYVAQTGARTFAPAGQERLDEATRRQLRSLGYVR